MKINITWAKAYKNIADDTYTFYGQLDNGKQFLTNEDWETTLVFNNDIAESSGTPYTVKETDHFDQCDWVLSIVAHIIRNASPTEKEYLDLIEIVARGIDPDNYEIITDKGTFTLCELVAPIAVNVLNHKQLTTDVLMLVRFDTSGLVEPIDYIYGATSNTHIELCEYMLKTLIDSNYI